jgi:hypothetical protein
MAELWLSWEIFADQLQLKPFERKRMERRMVNGSVTGDRGDSGWESHMKVT